jgi:small-conductance mechanosensitive channel
MVLDVIQSFIGSFIGEGVDIASVIVYYILVFASIFIFYRIVTHFLKRIIFTAAKTKKEKSNAIIFLHLWRYVFVVITIIVLIFAYSGSLEGLGLSAALLTAALGWALQRPISGVAGWFMVVIAKPFRIGDRISIGSIKGDVVDLSLTHIYIGEIGGTIGSEERSGRVIMVPNSFLFENNIVNYTFADEFVMDEILATVTYDSDIDKAKKLWEEAAIEATREFGHKVGKPTIRTFFQDSGILVVVRFLTPAVERERVRSTVTENIFKKVFRTKGVRFAYPHRELIMRKKKG